MELVWNAGENSRRGFHGTVAHAWSAVFFRSATTQANAPRLQTASKGQQATDRPKSVVGARLSGGAKQPAWHSHRARGGAALPLSEAQQQRKRLSLTDSLRSPCCATSSRRKAASPSPG